MTEIVLENLRKEFGPTVAVNDLSLKVDDGRFVSLVGPSGCGKTTTLRMIAGITAPTSGSIYFDGKVVNYLDPRERRIGMVFQDYAIFPHLTGFQNIAFGLKLRKLQEAEVRKRVRDVAELLDILHVLDKTPRRMNQSELQRVALARTLVTDPSVLLLDEPLSNLDAAFRVRMRAELKRLQMEVKQTAIYVTHDQIEAMALSDKIAVMNIGVLQQFGSPEELYKHPQNRFVAGFIGSPPMNFLEGSFEENPKGVPFIAGEGFKVEVGNIGSVVKEQITSSELTIGIRPQNIAIREHATKTAIKAKVYAFEPMGAESIVDVLVGGGLLRVVAPRGFSTKPGEEKYLEFDMNKLHIIDKATGKVIT
ncbi:MAG: ABC transporter ATP-binding protein [Candidatus Bathyarchaeia archaeon]